MNIVENVEVIVNGKNTIFSSQFYNNYKELMLKYNKLIEKGIVNKRQSQLCSISDKLQLISLNCNYYKSEKN
jgi:hypothetical protein